MAIFLILACAVGMPQRVAAERPEGLLWNRSGQAATLPLLVKTDSGQDYLMTLRDTDTDREVLAAYLRGGVFFRVLVPPGTFALTFASGAEWQGPEALFGPETDLFALDTPLTFQATVARREGHIVDLRGDGPVGVTRYAVCQRIEFEPRALLQAEDFDPDALREQRMEPPERDFELRERFCE